MEQKIEIQYANLPALLADFDWLRITSFHLHEYKLIRREDIHYAIIRGKLY